MKYAFIILVNAQEGLRMMRESIENDFITWHSFPHVPEYEVMDKYLLLMRMVMKQRKDVEYENSKKDEEESRIRYEEMDKKVNQFEKGIHNEENSSYEELIHQVD